MSETDKNLTNGQPEIIDEDLALVNEIVAGNPGKFELIVMKYEKTVFNTAWRFVGDFHEAEDLTQEIFVKIFRNLHRFEGRSKFFTWLYTITMNHLRSRHKPISRVLRDVMDLVSFDFLVPSLVDGVDKSVIRKEEMICLEKEILALPEKYREVIILRDINQQSYKEISEILSINMEAVKTRIHRGRSLLSSGMKKRGFE
jgi:RNA polymerase sigma-70 factor (ECF subfamily)